MVAAGAASAAWGGTGAGGACWGGVGGLVRGEAAALAELESWSGGAEERKKKRGLCATPRAGASYVQIEFRPVEL